MYFRNHLILLPNLRKEIFLCYLRHTNWETTLDVSLDWLVGLTDLELDQPTLKRIEQISQLPEEQRRQVYMLLDALLRDFKAREVYA